MVGWKVDGLGIFKPLVVAFASCIACFGLFYVSGDDCGFELCQVFNIMIYYFVDIGVVDFTIKMNQPVSELSHLMPPAFSGKKLDTVQLQGENQNRLTFLVFQIECVCFHHKSIRIGSLSGGCLLR